MCIGLIKDYRLIQADSANILVSLKGSGGKDVNGFRIFITHQIVSIKFKLYKLYR